eukprot:4993028-Lingulodinium_polyedra.AAC.1
MPHIHRLAARAGARDATAGRRDFAGPSKMDFDATCAALPAFPDVLATVAGAPPNTCSGRARCCLPPTSRMPNSPGRGRGVSATSGGGVFAKSGGDLREFGGSPRHQTSA